MIDLTDEQEAVLFAINEWRDTPAWKRDPYRTVGGYAGTGKTTIVSHLVNNNPEVAAVALCGKAAHVLRSKGVDARTIHSLLYIPMKGHNGQVRFRKRPHLDGVQLIVVDEASMVDHLVFQDLMSYKLPVLFIGDHGQLEPVGSNPQLMRDPHLRLEQIHRQAKDNPIIRFATALREGRQTPYWTDPKGRLLSCRRSGFEEHLTKDVQVICGFNRSRHQLNSRIRELGKLSGSLVSPGEKLICLQNNRHWNIFNGQQMTVLEVDREGKRTIDLVVETDDGRSFTLPCMKEQFGRDAIKDFKSKEVALMDYGYVLTAHKAQGSEWSEVLALEEIVSAWDAQRWRYTVATRAKDRLVYCS